MITLRSVYDDGNYPRVEAVGLLYQLLKERTPEQSISHHTMPTAREHTAFVKALPYSAWYIVEAGEGGHFNEPLRKQVGAVYLSRQREIGIGILRQFHRRGYGEAAVRAIMQHHPGGHYRWNVNPANLASMRLVEKLGGRLIQWTYAIGGG